MHQYRHRPREERLKEIIIGQGLVSLLVIVVSIFLVFWGLGYKIDWRNFTIKHTGIIYLAFEPKNAVVLIDNIKRQGTSPFDISLDAGHYDVAIQKDGFVPWTQTMKVEKDKVISARNITLFRQSPEISILTDKDSIASINAPYDSVVKDPQGDLLSSEYEIWTGDKLVTRFSEPIHNVVWYPGMEYIAFQQGDEIRIIAKNGTNDTLLVKLSAAAQSKFIFSWDGSALLYKDGDNYYKAIIN